MAESIQQEIVALARVRDELRLQMHLARAEAREVFDHLETRWPEIEARADELKANTSSSAHEVAEAARGLAQELRAGYEEVRRRLS
jgi:uncharacterized coiled-coil DUF342 family protein